MLYNQNQTQQGQHKTKPEELLAGHSQKLDMQIAGQQMPEALLDSQETYPTCTKVDTVFFKAYDDVREWTNNAIGYNSFKIAAMTSFLGYYYANHPFDQIFDGMVAAFFASLIILIARTSLKAELAKIRNIIEVARTLNHAMTERAEQGVAPSRIEDLVVSTFDFAVPDQVPDEEGQKAAIRILIPTVRNCFFEYCRTAKSLQSLGNAASFATLLFFMVGLGIYPMAGDMKSFLIAYVVIEGLVQIEFLLYAILCALSPLLCIGICAYMIIKRPKSARNYAEGLVPVKYHPSMQLKADPQCSICYQNFSIDDNIVVLGCSQSHAFHEFCIKSWFKVGSTCPLCRHNFAD